MAFRPGMISRGAALQPAHRQQQQPLPPPHFGHSSRQPQDYFEQDHQQQAPPSNVMRPPHDYRNTAAAAPMTMPREPRNTISPVEERRDFHNYFEAPLQPSHRQQQPLPPPRHSSRQPQDYSEQDHRQQAPLSNVMRPPHDYRNTAAAAHDYRSTAAAAPMMMPRGAAPESRNTISPAEERRDFPNYFEAPLQPSHRQQQPLPPPRHSSRQPQDYFEQDHRQQAPLSNVMRPPHDYRNTAAPMTMARGAAPEPRNAISPAEERRDFPNYFEAPLQPSHRQQQPLPPRHFEQNHRQHSNGFRGFHQQLDSQSTNRNRAQKGYVPHNRQIEEIFDEDSQDVNRHANTIFAGDADIEVEGESVPQRCEHWGDMNLDQRLVQNIQHSQYPKPRNIQQYVIPYMMDGYNIKCQSETGSGKSASFLIPVIDNLIRDKQRNSLKNDGPYCLIISPTRELTQQLYEQAKKFAFDTGISVSYAYGQVDTAKNLADIRRGSNILCACLGRLLDFVDSAHITLRNVRYLIIDEADRMMQNKEDNYGILKLLNYPSLPKKEERQTCLFSATLKDPEVEQISYEYVDDFKRLFIVAKNETNARIKYEVYAVPSIPSKFRYLICYLKEITEANNGVCPRVLVFVNRKINVDRVAIDITNAGFAATTIHGDRGQDLREEALASFKSGKTKCLVATDVCARGVDIKDMDYVINYDLPIDRTSFVQRCGRTGRNHNGVALSFYCQDHDSSMAQIIDGIIQDAGQESPAFLRSSVRDSDYLYEEEEEQQPQRQEQQPFSRQEADPSPVDSGRFTYNPSPYAEEQRIRDTTVDDEWN